MTSHGVPLEHDLTPGESEGRGNEVTPEKQTATSSRLGRPWEEGRHQPSCLITIPRERACPSVPHSNTNSVILNHWKTLLKTLKPDPSPDQLKPGLEDMGPGGEGIAEIGYQHFLQAPGRLRHADRAEDLWVRCLQTCYLSRAGLWQEELPRGCWKSSVIPEGMTCLLVYCLPRRVIHLPATVS